MLPTVAEGGRGCRLTELNTPTGCIRSGKAHSHSIVAGGLLDTS
ncbi:hypothetical protein SAMN05880557_102417 [Pseudacidovorax sp. RU35E]|nr:hypothetical protein SAMN05880557_102417 [Pseudacidovorax sp. RU35E]